ncbi:MAG: hypothetical protein WA985_05040 [Erythrobacter sp.]
MLLVVRALLMLAGLVFIVIGGSFLFYPVSQGSAFGLDAVGAQGLSSLRGDFTAYFWVTGIALVAGAWRKSGAVLLVPIAILGITFLVRALSLAIDGFYEGWAVPMAVEAATVLLALYARHLFGSGTRGLPSDAPI